MSRRDLFRAALRASAAAAIASTVPGCGDESESGEDNLDGAVFGPRPFYVCGHNPNTIAEVKEALAQGANAVEPDINVYKDGSGRLCISHGEGDEDAPSLEQYLKDLHTVAVANPQLAFVIFDCKPGSVSPENGRAILAAIRKHLTYDLKISFVISVAKFESVRMFDLIKDDLRPNEGVMIDEENDPVAVSNHFTKLGITNHGFGNGISILSCGILAPNARPSLEHACGMRAAGRKPRFIYAWTINCVDLEQEYMRIGVDGFVTDDVAEVRSVMREPEFAKLVRLATRDDNPFDPPNFTYALTVKTGDVSKGGTDANVTFTLNGTQGVAKRVVDTDYIRRMERNDTNYVTIHSPDIGELQSITVQRDDQGNAPAWHLEYILVASERYRVAKKAVFNKFIEDEKPHTIPLV